MYILSQDKETIINVNNIEKIFLIRIYGDDLEIDIIKESRIFAKSSNENIFLGKYKTVNDASKIIKKIYKALINNNLNYEME